MAITELTYNYLTDTVMTTEDNVTYAEFGKLQILKEYSTIGNFFCRSYGKKVNGQYLASNISYVYVPSAKAYPTNSTDTIATDLIVTPGTYSTADTPIKVFVSILPYNAFTGHPSVTVTATDISSYSSSTATDPIRISFLSTSSVLRTNGLIGEGLLSLAPKGVITEITTRPVQTV